MHIGTLLIIFGPSTQEYYTPWFSKGADNAYFTYEIIRQNFGTGGSPSPGFSVEVFTKNLEDVGSQGTTVSGSWANLRAPVFTSSRARIFDSSSGSKLRSRVVRHLRPGRRASSTASCLRRGTIRRCEMYALDYFLWLYTAI